MNPKTRPISRRTFLRGTGAAIRQRFDPNPKRVLRRACAIVAILTIP